MDLRTKKDERILQYSMKIHKSFVSGIKELQNGEADRIRDAIQLLLDKKIAK